MDYSIILGKYYLNYSWSCGENYESLEWYDETLAKPTQEHLESLWNDVLKDNMRGERNQLLKDCDCTVLPDYPSTDKEAWLAYRRELRNLPETWSESNPAFPTPPI
jgi:hypothetical protein